MPIQFVEPTGVGTGGGGEAPLSEKRVASTLVTPPPLFMVHLSLPCPQYIPYSVAKLPRMCPPPIFKYVATPLEPVTNQSLEKAILKLCYGMI